MIINFNNLGGGGGGSYTLPVATASRLGGVKIGDGLSITAGGVLSATGGSSSDGLKLWTAATKSDMEQLSAASEGDVCVVGAHFEEMPNEFLQGFEWGWGFTSCWWTYFSSRPCPSQLRLTLVENQYWDGQDDSSTQDGSSSEFYTSRYDETQQADVLDYHGVLCDNGEYKYFNDTVSQSPSPGDYLTFSGVGDSFVLDSADNFNGGGGNSESSLYEHSANTTYKYAIRIEQYVEDMSYQRFNDEWIEPASSELVSSAMTKAEEAYNTANNKVGMDSPSINSWGDLQYYSTFIGQVSLNSVDQGYRIHVPGADSERTNPKVTELVTSGDVAKIVALTQDEYDDMQTHDNNTLYAIIPDE